MNPMITWYPLLYIGLIVLVTLVFVLEQKKFHSWIFTYWGKKPTLFRKFYLLMYLISTLIFLGALADWRGDEVTLEGKKVSEKTILLIDNSLSMLAEDVRPNRYEKAILMARHFIKAAPGHEISVILFSDVNRKYVPFTTDIDLLDARIAGLKELYKNVGGSSNIKQAIREALDSLDPNPLARKGNVVVFSDADGMDEDFPLDIGPAVSVALIAIGTSTGAPIPVRGRDGVLQGHKTYQGQQVISKLNQQFLDSLATQIKNYKYWVVTSFSLPTNEILEFLQNKGTNSDGTNQNMRSREVLYEWWLVPAILLLLLSLILKRFKTWTIVSALMIFFLTNNAFVTTVEAQENKVKEILPLMDALKKNQLDDKGRLSIAQKLLEAGDAKKALQIYQETLEGKDINEGNRYSWLNYGQALAANKKSNDALKIMQQIQSYQEKKSKSSPQNSPKNLRDEEFNKRYAESLLSLLQSQQQEQKEKQEQQKKDQEEEKKDEKKEDKDQQGDKENDDQKEGADQDKNKDGQNKQDQEKNDKDKKENSEPKDEKAESQKSRSERQKELSSLLKQLLNEDRNLQQKLMETTTKDPTQRKNSNDGVKDW